ncbi:MAG: hypothetical protein HC817_03250 [Saprospiraceae bacterium]|nr:hypothetical protein [Saprospiraceae bacterium]
MLGTGGGNGFSIRPDFGRYGWLAVWDSEHEARAFLKENIFSRITKPLGGIFYPFLRTSAAHGKWDGATPFLPTEPFNIEASVAVLTRATIKTRHLHRFWRFVPTVSRSMEGKAGLVLALALGSYP